MTVQKRTLILHLTVPLFVLTLVGVLLGARPAAAAPPAAPGGWWGDYFDNPNLSGAPVLSRMDDAIRFGWGGDSPAPGLPADNFSIRWVRDEWFAGGTYRFEIFSDDGVRIWVGDQLVVDEWRDRWATPLIVDRYIPVGTYRVRVEYYEHIGDATISVAWNRLVGGATWRGEYFDNRDLEGWPALVRNDVSIDFDWGYGSPDPAVPADYFSVRWTRAVSLEAGTYRFLASTDDGARVWVDGALVVDAWVDQKLPTTHTGDVYLAAGPHTVVVEYYEHGGEAAAHVWWEVLDSFAAWHGEYFDNRYFIGGPVLVRGDAEINFDWGVGPPLEWLPDDNFAVRWTRPVNFTPGYYRFVVLADDGVRVWVDQDILIDKWQDMDYELHYVDGTYLQGQRTVRVEYYENTGHARVRFWWEPGTDGNAPPSFVPVEAPPAAADPSPLVGGEVDDPWAAAYFATSDLSGEPVLTRVETALDHNWGWGSPGSGVPKDRFSARWTQALSFRAGTYRFTTYTDDGVRLWVDGRLLIDAWRPMRGTRSATVRLGEGRHDVKMEYFERTGVARARLTWLRVSR
jgi:hypothetical protein